VITGIVSIVAGRWLLGPTAGLFLFVAGFFMRRLISFFALCLAPPSSCSPKLCWRIGLVASFLAMCAACHMGGRHVVNCRATLKQGL